MIMIMMGLTPGPLVRALLFFAFTIMLVVLETLLVVLMIPVFMCCGVGTGIFALTEIKSIDGVLLLVVLVPKGVVSKGG